MPIKLNQSFIEPGRLGAFLKLPFRASKDRVEEPLHRTLIDTGQCTLFYIERIRALGAIGLLKVPSFASHNEHGRVGLAPVLQGTKTTIYFEAAPNRLRYSRMDRTKCTSILAPDS